MPVVNPGIRRLLASAIQRLFNGASFSAPLTHSLVPERGTGSPTFTRATTATVTDNEGVLRTAIAGEARFEGARRVRNLVTKSEDLTSGWAANNAGSVTATTITFTAASNDGWNVTGLTVEAGRTYLWSALMSATSGTKNVRFRCGGGALSSNIGLTTTPTRVSAVFTAVTAGATNGIYNESGGGAATVNCTEMQLEDITGRADQTTPSEYVSVGVASSPYYHGSMVDGVKCFLNDLSGNPIPSTTMLGYVAEGARTNVLIRSNTISSWSLSGTPSVTQNAIGPDGGTTGWTITDDDGAATEFPYLSSTLTAATYTVSAFVKKTVGAQSNYPVLAVDNGVNMAIATVDTTNGVITSWSAYTGRTINTLSSTITSFNDDYWRASITFTGTAVAWNTYLIPSCTSSATFAGPAFDATVTGSAVFYGAQVELGSFASSYIPTTTTSATRNADQEWYPNSTAVTVFGIVKREPGVTSVGHFLHLGDGGSTDYAALLFNNATSPRFAGSVGGVAQWDITATDAYAPGTEMKIAYCIEANNIRWCINGVMQTGDVSASIPTFTRIEPGSAYGLQFQLDGNVHDVRTFSRALSNAELQAITA